MAFILKSNNIVNLYSAKGANLWAFSKRKNRTADLALKSWLDNHITVGTQVIGYVTNDIAGALMYGTVRESAKDKEVTDIIWNGTYQFPIVIDWHFINKDKSLIPSDKIKEIVDDLRGGHFPKEITSTEFAKIIS